MEHPQNIKIEWPHLPAHEQQLRSGPTAFQAKGYSCQPLTLQDSWLPLATTQARGHPCLPLCPQHLWTHHNKREHTAHTDGNLGAPGSGGQWRLHFWALQDIPYQKLLPPGEETYLNYLIHRKKQREAKRGDRVVCSKRKSRTKNLRKRMKQNGDGWSNK